MHSYNHLGAHPRKNMINNLKFSLGMQLKRMVGRVSREAFHRLVLP